MAENKEIIEKLVELIEIYLENAQMNEVSTEWQEGDIDFEEVLSIVVHDGLYDLNFTEEQTDEFLALYKALNQKQVEISEAKLSKEDKKGDYIMEKEVKKEAFFFEDELKKLGKEITTAAESAESCKGTSWCIIKPEWFNKYKDAGYRIFVKGSGKDAIGSLVKDGKVVQKVDAMDRQLESYLEGVKPMNEWFRFDNDTRTLEQKYGKEIKTWEEMQVAARGTRWAFAGGEVGFSGKPLPGDMGSGKRYWDNYSKRGKFFLSGEGDKRILTFVELEPKITRFDAMDRPVADESLGEAKTINEWFRFDTDTKTLEQKYGKEIKTWEEMKVAAKGTFWGMAGDAGFDGKVIPESGKRYWDAYTKNGGKFFLSGTGDSRVLTLVELEPKVTRFDAMDRPVEDVTEELEEAKKPVMEKFTSGDTIGNKIETWEEMRRFSQGTKWVFADSDGEKFWNLHIAKGSFYGLGGNTLMLKQLNPNYKDNRILTFIEDTGRIMRSDVNNRGIFESDITDADKTLEKKPVMESKKPIKEGIRLVYTPKAKEEIKMGPDGEPLPIDIRESNTHTKLRLFKHK